MGDELGPTGPPNLMSGDVIDQSPWLTSGLLDGGMLSDGGHSGSDPEISCSMRRLDIIRGG